MESILLSLVYGVLCAYMQNSSKSSKYLAYIYSREHYDKSIHMKISTDSLIWVLS